MVRASSREMLLERRSYALCTVRHNDGNRAHLFLPLTEAGSFKPMATFFLRCLLSLNENALARRLIRFAKCERKIHSFNLLTDDS